MTTSSASRAEQRSRPELPRKIRVLVGKPGLDGHDRGAKVMASALRDAGFEVIFANFLLPEEIVSMAIQESVDVVGISSSSGGHMHVFDSVLDGLHRVGLDDVLIIGGGVIPPADVRKLKSKGVVEVFGPGSTAEDAISLVQAHAAL